MGKGNNKKAVVLLSGGIDSSTSLAIAKAEGFDAYAISFDYSQRHWRELESARMVAEHLAVKRHITIQFDLREIGGSALTADIEVPKKNSQQSEEKSAIRVANRGPQPTIIPVTYVPARNTIFLSFALGWAEVLGADDIFIGANAVDYSGYPDCRPEYLKAFEDMANLATKASVEGIMRFRVNAPLLSMTKSDIVRKGIELGIDYSLTWSCYDPQVSNELQVISAKSEDQSKNSLSFTPHSSLIPCGRCDSCLFREKGFTEAGIKDPLKS